MRIIFYRYIFCQFLFAKFNSRRFVTIYYLIQFLSILSWEEQLCKIWCGLFCLFLSPPNCTASRRQFPNTHKSNFSYLIVSDVSALNRQCIKAVKVSRLSVVIAWLQRMHERVYRLVQTCLLYLLSILI